MEKIKFVKGIIPLQKLRFQVGTASICMKRDDLIGFGGGGNKVRLFEYIASDIRRTRVEKIITFGSVYPLYSDKYRAGSLTALP